jgi:3-hydroxybutyryl-CoA dehydrogenase
MTNPKPGQRTAVGVVGGGTMGIGIAYVFAAARCPTYVVEPDTDRAAALSSEIARVAGDGVQRSKLTTQEATDLVANVQVISAITELPVNLSIVIESVPERLELKARVLREVEQRNPEIIASNTSALSINELAVGLQDPSRFIGMHFFNPVWSLALVEVVQGEHSSEKTIQSAIELVTLLRKKPVVVRDSPGFATSRLDLIASLEAMRMVQDGVASAADIDTAMVTAYRHPMGPLRLSDVVGLDVRLDIARALAVSLGDRYSPPKILEELVAAGHLGVKTGKGFYDWNNEPPTTTPNERSER